MNHGDTFVLDAGDFIFIWSGISSSGMEKMKAASLAGKLRDKVGETFLPSKKSKKAPKNGLTSSLDSLSTSPDFEKNSEKNIK